MPVALTPFRALGDAMRDVRAHLGLGQARLAHRAGKTPNWLSPFENGRTLPPEIAWKHWLEAVDAVDVSDRDEDWLEAFEAKLRTARACYAAATAPFRGDVAAPEDPGGPDLLPRDILLKWERMAQVEAGGAVKRRAFLGGTVKAATALPIAAALPSEALTGCASIVDGAIRHTDDLRDWYRHLPGALLLPLAEANRSLLVQLTAEAGDGARPALLNALGETEMLLGWINAFDTGDHPAAARHFTEALGAVRRSGDRPLAALVLAAMTILARHLNQLQTATALAEQSTALLGNAAPPTVSAFAHVVAASAHAKAGRELPAARSLDKARAAVARFTAEDVAGWRGIGMWNEVRFAEYEGSVLIKRNRPEEAERAIQRGLDQLDRADAKYRALYLANLAHARSRQGHLDGGCETATQAVRIAGEAGHALSLHVVWTMLDELAEHRAHPAIASLKDELLTVARPRG